MHRRPTFHDSDVSAGREIMEHTGLTSSREAIGEVFGPAASIAGGQTETACKPSSSKKLGR